MAKTFRIFISSPSDVFAERERVERVIVRLNGEFGGSVLEAIRWERSYYTAAKTFQDQIPLPSQTDLVVCILWKRLGFELPPDYRRADGTTPTGTEYEFEDAMAAARARGTPDVLVYRKAAPVLLDAEQVELERAQFEALKAFWGRWFRNETGNFTAAYQTFDTPDQFETVVEEHIRQWLARHHIASDGVTWPIELRGSPFRGLQAFDAAHASVFFGRRRVIERALERLTDAAGRGTPFLLILGPSGSGKSSVARAGLQPRVTQPGAVAGVDAWRTCTLRPSEGNTPLHALALALFRPEALPELAAGDSATADEFAALLAGAPEAAARAVSKALGRATAPIAAREGFDRALVARLLLTLDQFEEALLAPAAREAFAGALTALVASGQVWVVGTLRSDLYALFQASRTLLQLRDAGAQLDLLAPSGAELAETVTGPAAAAGLRFERRPDGTGLEEELIEAAHQPGALPLLQLALDALFEARDPATNLLTCAAYDAGGGLSGVVERRAEATLAAVDAEAAAALPVALRALVEVTDDGVVTSRAAPVPSHPAARRLADAFIAARLLVAETHGAETRLRVAHDALLSGWPRAAALIEADREMLRTRTRVEGAARRWIAEKREADYLLPPGRPLAEAVELAARQPDSLDPDSAAFVAASREADAAREARARAHEQRELQLEAEAQQARADAATRMVRQTRRAAVVVLALAVLACGAAAYATLQRQEAQRQTAEAGRQAALAREQTASAERNFKAALDGGATLIGKVDAHLTDGGMTRRVARELLETADTGIGALLPRNRDAALPPPLLDTDSRLQASFSRVLVAVCAGAEGRQRAERAVAVAEAALREAPTEARALAVMEAEHALGTALGAENDWAGATATFTRAVARAEGQHGPAWRAALQQARRDLAYAISDGPDRARAATLARDDLAWQATRAAPDPDDPEILGQQAADYRILAIVARSDQDAAAVRAAVDAEAAVLRRLAARQPNNLAWERYLASNARALSVLLSRQGDRAGALAKAREAASRSEALLAHDPENALWRIAALSNDVRLSVLLMSGGDEAGARATLRPAIEAVKALAAPGAGQMCLAEAAQMQSTIGNAMVVLGSGENGIVVLEAGLALAQTMARAAPGDRALQLGVVTAEEQLARAMMVDKKPQRLIPHAAAGIAGLLAVIAAGPDDPQLQLRLTELRRDLGDAQQETGDMAGALATFAADQATLKTLLAAQPDQDRWRIALARSLMRTAATQLKAEQPVEQWAALQEARHYVAPLEGKAGLPTDWQRSLIDLHQFIGSAQITRHEVEAGLAEYKVALHAAEALAAATPADVQARLALALSLGLVSSGYRAANLPEEAAPYAARSKAVLEGLKPHG